MGRHQDYNLRTTDIIALHIHRVPTEISIMQLDVRNAGVMMKRQAIFIPRPGFSAQAKCSPAHTNDPRKAAVE